MSASANAWIPIWANSTLIHYAGDWNTTTYKPLNTNASATLNFTGSGIAFKGYGQAGARTDQGLLFDIDPESDSPSQTVLLLDYDVRNDTRGDHWLERDLPPGEHQVALSTRWDGANVTFLGYDVKVNATLYEPYPDTLVQTQRVSSDDVEFFGSQKEENDELTYALGPGSGYAFNFTGVGVTVTAQSEFEVDTPYSVYINATGSPPTFEVVPFARYPGKKGPANQIFFAAGLPQGQHRVVVVNEGERLALRRADALYPQLFNDVDRTCWSGCSADQSEAGTGIGVTYEENGAMGRKIGWGALVLGMSLALVGTMF